MLHQEQMTPEIVAPLKPRAMLLSGCGTFFQHFKPETFYNFEDTLNAMADVPTMGLCASHQLMGFMFNDGFRNLTRLEDEMMRPLRPGEPDVLDPNPDALGYFCEEGFYPVSPVRSGGRPAVALRGDENGAPGLRPHRVERKLPDPGDQTPGAASVRNAIPPGILRRRLSPRPEDPGELLPRGRGAVAACRATIPSRKGHCWCDVAEF